MTFFTEVPFQIFLLLFIDLFKNLFGGLSKYYSLNSNLFPFLFWVFLSWCSYITEIDSRLVLLWKQSSVETRLILKIKDHSVECLLQD